MVRASTAKSTPAQSGWLTPMGKWSGSLPSAKVLIWRPRSVWTWSKCPPNAEPPVCKILDYGKYKYEAQKKKAEARKKQKVIEVKEIKLRPNIDDNDYDVKMRAMRKFLEEGDKVKVTLRFRGREMAHQDLGMKVLDRVREHLDDPRQGGAIPQDGRSSDGHGDGAALTAGRFPGGAGFFEITTKAPRRFLDFRTIKAPQALSNACGAFLSVTSPRRLGAFVP